MKKKNGKLVEEKIRPPKGYKPNKVLANKSFGGTLWHRPLIGFSISLPKKPRTRGG